ncbi:hypothetical protein DPMN_052256 [Dreissena polymorpha]|uniref:RNase H type-1 domain-containing protein n=1 Tax=Dreissena polymorpha TaxID=45954 RepID=A0A9D4CJC9_DREPO|nr:hypothetical protein DPMN_052256 [Dreissena polymorpha]
MSSLESIKNRNSRSRPDILASILELHQQGLDKSLKVTLVWCPAHVNISGNEQADRGANEGLLRGALMLGNPWHLLRSTPWQRNLSWVSEISGPTICLPVDILLPDPRKPSGRLTDTRQALCLTEPSGA